MVMVPDIGKMHLRHSDQQNSSGGDPDSLHGLRNFGARRVGLHTTWSTPQAKNPSYGPGTFVASLYLYDYARCDALLQRKK